MGYRIVYTGRFAEEMIRTNITKKEKQSNLLLWLYLSAAVILLFVTYLEHGSVQPILIPGDPAVTLDAIRSLKDHMAGGGSFVEAFSCFCRTVLEAAF
ncbi:MAG: hypothetical protein IKU07_06565 [Oscillospiraceae bacterium]|nr:hypothetical protein [Oscillospiraceae bacterium]